MGDCPELSGGPAPGYQDRSRGGASRKVRGVDRHIESCCRAWHYRLRPVPVRTSWLLCAAALASGQIFLASRDLVVCDRDRGGKCLTSELDTSCVSIDGGHLETGC